jgi:hypothetical protein
MRNPPASVWESSSGRNLPGRNTPVKQKKLFLVDRRATGRYGTGRRDPPARAAAAGSRMEKIMKTAVDTAPVAKLEGDGATAAPLIFDRQQTDDVRLAEQVLMERQRLTDVMVNLLDDVSNAELDVLVEATRSRARPRREDVLADTRRDRLEMARTLLGTLTGGHVELVIDYIEELLGTEMDMVQQRRKAFAFPSIIHGDTRDRAARPKSNRPANSKRKAKARPATA